MLEGVIARLLNRWLGKYVLDLDTENLNVGIFSGQVQLTELRLKPEALYELDLPIEVKFGTIGKICIQIPWNALMNQPVIVQIEDVHVLVGPIVSGGTYDADRDKRLTRAAKKKILSDLEQDDGELIGGPDSFPEHLFTSLINNLQVTVQNIHIRYEDNVSQTTPLAVGLCISGVTAETTNSRWKAATTGSPRTPPNSQTGTAYHLVKLESVSVYWNHSSPEQNWDFENNYYGWRNTMMHSLHTFSMGGVDFEFLVKPMTCKIKFIINKSNGGRILKVLVDVMLQDLTLQLTREQYLSLCAVVDSLSRMYISRRFIYLRPNVPIRKNVNKWWLYAYECVLEQRVRPYTWRRIATVRANYRLYKEAYRRVLLNPNDTELKLDLQKYEDTLDIVNVVIARRHALLKLRHEQQNEEDHDHQQPEKSPSTKGSLWSMLPSPERLKLCRMIGYIQTPTSEMSLSTSASVSEFHRIEHKYNLTVGNLTLALLRTGREVLVLTLTQLLASVETIPGSGCVKVSGRAEGMVLEGANLEDHLVPLISAEHHYNGVASNDVDAKTSMTPNVFSIDYEKCPSDSEAASCRLWCSLEAVGIVFHTHAVAELLEFLEDGDFGSICTINHVTHEVFLRDIPGKLIRLARKALDNRVDLNLDIRVPYLVIPEHGAANKSGSQLIVDLGRLVVRTELAPFGDPSVLEDATQNELEEQLYSRLHVDLFQVQLLFCDSGENWRDARKEIDTEMHLVSKTNILFIFSSCVRHPAECGGLPGYKLNITVPSLKFNASERKIDLVLTYLEHVGKLLSDHQHKCSSLWMTARGGAEQLTAFPKDLMIGKWTVRQLVETRSSVRAPWRHRPPTCRLSAARSSRRPSDLPSTVSAGRADPPEPSEHSEDASEAWARCVDLPGLEDNVSPSNSIRGLSRLILGELSIVLSRSSERIDRPYLTLRIDKTYIDLASMDYGPALQLTIGSLTLTDKMHTSVTGQYLDLIHVPLLPADSTTPQQDLLQVLYRKVRADCPDFRSHFHSVERSLVADFGPVCFVVHRDALRTLVKYTRYLHDRINRHAELITDLESLFKVMFKYVMRGGSVDPPVPPGAVKFSHSVRLASVVVRLCDSDSELLEAKITGFETDIMFRANERMVLRSYLTGLAVDHLAEVTLYTRVLSVDEDKVFEAKYVRHAPCPCRSSDVLAGIRSRPTDVSVSADGNLRIHVGRVQITLLYKLALQLRRFLEPLLPSGKARVALTNYIYNSTIGQIKNSLTSGDKLQVGLYIHGPTILLPQKTASPNLVVVHTGELTIENFFKESSGIVIENMLVRAEGATVVRAVMTLASSLEMQEVMLEPLSVRLDIKRTLPGAPRSAVPVGVVPRPPTWDIDGVIDAIKITVGQRDLSTLLAVYVDNMSEGLFVELSPDTTGPRSGDIPPSPPPSPVGEEICEDSDTNENLRSLEVFFCQGEAKHKEISIRLLLEEMQLSLFSDCEELLSSPVRDFNKGLCRLDIGEIHLSGDVYNDGGLEAKLSIHTLGVEDIRPEVSHSPGTQRILYAIRSNTGGHTSQQISVSMPPTVDVSFHQNRNGDRFIDVIVERLCFQLSVPFVVAFGRFISDSIPCANRRAEVGGVINHGYVGDGDPVVTNKNKRPMTGLTLALRICRPELIILSSPDGDEPNERNGSIITRTEILVDYSRHSMRENLIISLSNLHVLYSHGSNRTGRRHSEPYVVLHPCDVEYSRSYRAEEDGTRASASVSSVQLHTCPSFIHSVHDLFDDLSLRINLPWNIDPEQDIISERSHEDLWLPKRMSRSFGSGGDDSGIDADEQPVVPYGNATEGIENGETVLVASASSVSIVLELESGRTTIPVVMVHMSAEATVHDWSGGRAHGTLEVHLQSNYYNGRIGQWEPLIEPVPCPDGTHRPWQILVRVFKDITAVPTPINDTDKRSILNGASQKKRERTTKSGSSSCSGEDDGADGSDGGSDGGMVFLRAPTSPVDKNAPRVAASLAAFLDDSDTDTEDCGTMERFASAICDLFTGDWNESDGDSDGGGSSDSDQADDSPGGDSGETALERCRRPDGRTASGLVRRTTYILVDSKDVLNITLTSETIQLLKSIIAVYCCASDKISRALVPQDSNAVVLANDICPGAKVELLRNTEESDDPQLVCSRTFEKVDSPPGSPDDSSEEDGSDVDSNADSIGSSTGRRIKTYDCDWSTQGDRDPLLASLHFNPLSTATVYQLINQERLRIVVPGFDPILTSCPSTRSWCRLLRLEPPFRHQRYHLFIGHETNAISGRKIIVRSPLQLRNETCHALAVFYERAALQQLGLEAVGEVVNPFGGTVRIVVLEPQDIYNVPLHLAYHCRLHVRPVGADGHHLRLRAPSTGGIWWPELAADLGTPKDIKCDDEGNSEEEETGTLFMLRAIAVEGTAQTSLYKNQQQQTIMASKSVPNYMIRVVPPLSLRNRLPYAIVVHIGGSPNQTDEKRQSIRIEAGDRVTMYTLDGRKAIRFQLELGYLGLLWTGGVTLTEDAADDRLVQMATEHDTDGGNKQLTIAVRVSRRDTVVVHFYSPYWIVNRTGLPLQLRGASSGVVYDSVGEAPLLYAHRRRPRQGQQRCGGTVRVRAYQSSWSAEFSLDAAGTAGLVVCRDKERGRKYSLLAACAPSRSSPRLTRIVTLLPNWLVCNATSTHLRYMELNERTDLWLDLPPGGCCPFWPETPGQLMCVKHREGRVASPAFTISRPHRTALRMDNGGAVCVDVSGGGERPLTITFRPYRPGDAPVRVDNACADLYLKVCQKSTGHVTLLSPYHSLLYTWDDPNAERTLVWNVYNNRSTGHQVDVCRDGNGEIRVSVHVVRPPNVGTTQQRKSSSSATDSDDDDNEEHTKRVKRRPPTARTDKLTVYWLCYMDGGQRTLLLTQEKRTIEERSLTTDGSIEICLSLAGVGVSLCAGGSGGGNSEVLYASLSDSPPMWEVYIAHRWKTLTLELASWLEDKYLSQHKKCQLKDYVLIDLEKMYMLKPFYGELRRTYHPAVWIEERTSRYLRQRKLILNCIQIDGGDPRNGPCNILKAQPPNINTNGNGRPLSTSPCLQITSVAQRTPYNSKIIPYESVKVRLHEFELNLDGRLIERLIDMLLEGNGQMKSSFDSPNLGEVFRKDMALVRAPLCTPTTVNTNQMFMITEFSVSTIKLKLGLHSPGMHRHHLRRTTLQPDPDGASELPLLLDYMYACLEAFCTPPAIHITFTVPDLEIKDICSESLSRFNNDIKAHFISCFMQQFHVQVLGADVLLNPYGAGEDSSISIPTPETTIEKHSTGDVDLEKTARCLMGHVHGPTVLLLSLCSGEHLLRYSMEADRRRRGRYTPPAQLQLPETVTIASTGSFIYGVTLGLYGLFHRGELEGFFRGPGRALASLMGSTRGGVSNVSAGSGGVADCAAVSLDAIRRAAFLGERSVSIVRQRLIRHCDQQQLGLRMYSQHEAIGKILLSLVSGGQYASDIYWAHAPLNAAGKTILLITMQHVFLVENIRLWGPWDVQWAIELDEIVSVPKIVEQAIHIIGRNVPDKQDKEDANDTQIYKVSGEQDVVSWLREKLEQAMVLGMEDKCWTSDKN